MWDEVRKYFAAGSKRHPIISAAAKDMALADVSLRGFLTNKHVLCGPGVSLTLCCFVVYSTRRFVVCLSVCHFVLVFFSPFSIAITSLGEEKANLSAFRTFVRFVLVWICRFPLPLGVWEGLRFVVVALPGLFSYLS